MWLYLHEIKRLVTSYVKSENVRVQRIDQNAEQEKWKREKINWIGNWHLGVERIAPRTMRFVICPLLKQLHLIVKLTDHIYDMKMIADILVQAQMNICVIELCTKFYLEWIHLFGFECLSIFLFLCDWLIIYRILT